MKAIKHLASILELLSSRSASISGRISIQYQFVFLILLFFSTDSDYSSNTNKTQLIALYFRCKTMANFLLKHLRTIAITSATLTSSYFLFHHDRLPSFMTIKAAEYVNRNGLFQLK